MPKSSAAKLKFQAAYNKRPEELAKRILNNQARAEAMKKGLVHKGDGKDIAHLTPLDQGGGNTPGNTEVETRKKNRGWRATRPGMYGDKK